MGLLRRAAAGLILTEQAAGLPREEKKALEVSVILALSAGTVTVIAIVVSLVRGGWFSDISRISLISNTICLEIYVVAWLLLRFRYFQAGKLVVAIGGLLHITGLVAAFGFVAGVQYYYFAAAVAPLIIFPSRDRFWRPFLITTPLVLFVLANLYYLVLKRPALIERPFESMYIGTFLLTNSILSVTVLVACVYHFYRVGHAAEVRLDEERARSESLLLNILPEPVAARLKDGERLIADRFENATVLFADLVGFTPLSAQMSPEDLLRLLNDVFTDFDRLADEHGLEKIKTIGDAYMAVGGVPEAQADHAVRTARMALGMLEVIHRHSQRTGLALNIRIGLHSGPLVAGVIGERKFIYDLWGDTVNTASRMEASGVAGAVQVTPATKALLSGNFRTQSRGLLEIKGKGPMEVFLLVAG